MRTIAILHSGSDNAEQRKQIKTFSDFLALLGYSEPKSLKIVGPCFADDDPAVLKTCADTLVKTANLDVLVAAGGTRSLEAAKAARGKSDLMIVFTSGSAPPSADARLTGVGALTAELDEQRLVVLHELIGKPTKPSIGVLKNPTRPNAAVEWAQLSLAAAKLNVTLVPKDVTYSKNIKKDIDDAFAALKGQVSAILVTADPLFNNRRKDVVAAAKDASTPTIYQWREFAEDGGLISMGTKLTQAYKMAASYVGLILKNLDSGTNPGILKVLSPRTELVINIKTAADLKMEIPPMLLGRADDLIT
jgi:putative ABC transport system substrate-binding protein